MTMQTLTRAPIPSVHPDRRSGAGAPRLPGLDGLRALAVAAVIAYHGDERWMPGGFLGVEVFFVVSGYLITSLLITEEHRNGRVSLKHFWMRRARRLLPALLTMLTTVAVVMLIFLPHEVARTKAQFLAALGYYSNWQFIASNTSYFAALGRPSMLRHLWSLAIEEQYYLVWPLALVALLRRCKHDLARVAVVLATFVLGANLLMAVLYHPGHDATRAYMGTDTRAGGLLCGALLALFWRPSRLRHAPVQRLHLPLDVAGVGALYLLWRMLRAVHGESSWLYRGGFLAVDLATVIVIAAVAMPGGVLGRYLLGARPLRWIGDRSYGLYLWHWPIFMLTRPGIDLHWNRWLVLALRLSLTLVIAQLCFTFIEQPVRHGAVGRWWQSLRAPSPVRRRVVRRSALLGLMVVPLLAGVAMAVARTSGSSADDEIAASLRAGQAALAATTTQVRLATTTSTTTPTTTTAPSTTTTALATTTVVTTPATASVTVSPETTIATVATTVATTAPPTTAAPETAPATVAATVAPPPPTTTAAPLPPSPAPVTMIGDSVMLGAAPALQVDFPTAHIDAVVSRSFGQGFELAQALRDQGLLGPVVVIHLGTNGAFSAAQLDQLMQVLAAVPKVIFLNVHVPGRAYQDTVNAMLAAQLPQYKNVAPLIDWNGITADKSSTDFFYKDGIHLRPPAQKFYADLIRQAVG